MNIKILYLRSGLSPENYFEAVSLENPENQSTYISQIRYNTFFGAQCNRQVLVGPCSSDNLCARSLLNQRARADTFGRYVGSLSADLGQQVRRLIL